jgi:hypothetical protein
VARIGDYVSAPDAGPAAWINHQELEALAIDPADGITWESDQLDPPPA